MERIWITELLLLVREPFNFPSVTICNNNQLLLSKINKDPEISQAFKILQQLTGDIKPVNLTLREMIDRIGPEFKATYKMCLFKSLEIGCQNLFRGVFDLLLKCYTFNSNSFDKNPDIIKVQRHGMGSGMEIHLDCQSSEYSFGLGERSAGVGFAVSLTWISQTHIRLRFA